MLKRRERIVSFRVSEEEYLNLCSATEAAGAHSISDFARHVACHHSLVFSSATTNGNGSGNGYETVAAVDVHPAPALAVEVGKLRKRVDELTQQMQVLVRRVNRGI